MAEPVVEAKPVYEAFKLPEGVKLDEPLRAIEPLKKAAVLAGIDAHPLLYLAQAYSAMSRWDEARRTLAQARTRQACDSAS